jgi:hypothetical protein
MSIPKLHHYVPKHYLKRFCNASGYIYSWNKQTDEAFRTRPDSVAAENYFYYVDDLAERGRDPFALEKHFADLEAETNDAINRWLECIRDGHLGMPVPISNYERALVSLFISLQFLRTADTRELLVQVNALKGHTAVDHRGHMLVSERMRRSLHTYALWNNSGLEQFRCRLETAFWIFARNPTEIPLVISDNPVAFRRYDLQSWVKIGQLHSGTVIVYPLAPDVLLYCHPREEPWLLFEEYDATVSTIALTEKMVVTENTAQPFMASRFVFSPENDFRNAREYMQLIEPPGVYVPHRGSSISNAQ